MERVKFKTKSGTIYELSDIDRQEDQFIAGFRRMGVPMVDMFSGGDIDTSNDDVAVISFAVMPTLGESFRYWHDSYMGCISTPVVEIMEEE